MPPDAQLPPYLRDYLQQVFPWNWQSSNPNLAECLTAAKEPERIWADMSPEVRWVMKVKALFYHTPCDPALCALHPLFKSLTEELKERFEVVNAAEVQRRKKWRASQLDARVRLNGVPIYVVNLDCNNITLIEEIPRTPWNSLDVKRCLLRRDDLEKLNTRKSRKKSKGHEARRKITEYLEGQIRAFKKMPLHEQFKQVWHDPSLKDLFEPDKVTGKRQIEASTLKKTYLPNYRRYGSKQLLGPPKGTHSGAKR